MGTRGSLHGQTDVTLRSKIFECVRSRENSILSFFKYRGNRCRNSKKINEVPHFVNLIVTIAPGIYQDSEYRCCSG